MDNLACVSMWITFKNGGGKVGSYGVSGNICKCPA